MCYLLLQKSCGGPRRFRVFCAHLSGSLRTWWTETLWRISRWTAHILSSLPSSFSARMESLGVSGVVRLSSWRSLNKWGLRWSPFAGFIKRELMHAHSSTPHAAQEEENTEPRSWCVANHYYHAGFFFNRHYYNFEPFYFIIRLLFKKVIWHYKNF